MAKSTKYSPESVAKGEDQQIEKDSKDWVDRLDQAICENGLKQPFVDGLGSLRIPAVLDELPG